MSLLVDVRPEAKGDIYERGLYFLEHAGLEAFDRFHDTLKQALILLADRPELGERFRCTNPTLSGLRRWRVNGFSEHVVYYRPQGDVLEVLRVLHGKRDLRRIFK